jgi:hypothetical protein
MAVVYAAVLLLPPFPLDAALFLAILFSPKTLCFVPLSFHHRRVRLILFPLKHEQSFFLLSAVFFLAGGVFFTGLLSSVEFSSSVPLFLYLVSLVILSCFASVVVNSFRSVHR